MKRGDLVRTKIDIESVHVSDPELIGFDISRKQLSTVPRGTFGVFLEERTTFQPTYGSTWVKWVTTSGLVGWSYEVAFEVVS